MQDDGVASSNDFTFLLGVQVVYCYRLCIETGIKAVINFRFYECGLPLKWIQPPLHRARVATQSSVKLLSTK